MVITMETILLLNCLMFALGSNYNLEDFIEEELMAPSLELSWETKKFTRSQPLAEGEADGMYVLRKRRSVHDNDDDDLIYSGTTTPLPPSKSTSSSPTKVNCESMDLLKNKDGECVESKATFNVKMRILEDFLSGYADNTTMEFKNLSEQIINSVDKAYSNNGNYLKTYITSFTNGSVIAIMQLVFQNAQSTPLVELKSAIEKGSFGNLKVDTKNIAIILGDSCIASPCSPNATCTDLEDGQYNCTCKEDFSGNGTFCEGFVKVDTTIIIQEKFTALLNNESSPEYIQFATNFTQELVKVFKNQTNFVGIKILSVSNGSIRVDFLVIYRSNNPSKKILEVELVAKTLQRETLDGFIGNLVLVEQGILIREPPPPPVNVSLGEIKETQISVKWDPPKNSDFFSIKSYLIIYHTGNTSLSKPIVSNKQNGQLDNLKGDTFYEIYILAINEHGKGEKSKSMKVKTDAPKKDNLATIIVIVVVVVVIIALIVTIGYLIVKRKRYEVRRTWRETGEIALSFRDRPNPSDWRNIDIMGISSPPNIVHQIWGSREHRGR